ncbi:MAG TPA: hypothetical protein VE222_06855, partial [Nitrospiraceae bacterium]|nr:hypothetical protein [Nitrospiraceae bacterium]
MPRRSALTILASIPFRLSSPLFGVTLLSTVLVACLTSAEAFADSVQRAEEGGGFQSNHIMLSGPGGDSVNPFSGDAETVISVGPTLKAGGGLELGLKLYNSTKIWTRYDSSTDVYRFLKRRGAFGVGWKLHLGRIYSSCRNSCNAAADWMFESSDGAQHPLDSVVTPDPNTAGAITYYGTTDSTFYRAEYYDPNNHVATAPTSTTPATNAYWKIYMGNGVVYTLDHRLKLAGDNNHDTDSADESDDFRGWYTSSIEKWDTPGHAVGRILITYDTGTSPSGSLAHCLKKIEFQALNSSGTLTTKRQIDFGNATSIGATTVEGGYTSSITFPALNGQTSTTATYTFTYYSP